LPRTDILDVALRGANERPNELPLNGTNLFATGGLRTNLSQLLAALVVMVSVVSLALAVCRSLIMILAGEPPVAPFGTGTVLPLSPLAIGSGIFLATA